MSAAIPTQRRGGAESGVAARALLDGRFERISCAQRKPLWSVTIWDKKFNSVATGKQTTAIKYNYLLAGDLKEKIVPGGNVKLLTTSETDWWTTEDKVAGLVSEGEIVSIPWGGNPNVQYFKGRFVTADNRIATSSDKTVLDNKFLYYFMLAKRNTIGSFYRGAGLKHPEMAKVLDMEIPLPSIDVQRSFVYCMDNVSKVIAARKMQLDSLSQLVKSRFVEMFGEIKYPERELITVTSFIDYRGKTPTKSDRGVPLITAKNVRANGFSLEPREYIPEELFAEWMTRGFPRVGDVLFTTEAPLGNVCRIPNLYDRFAVGQRIVTMQVMQDVLDSSYLEHALKSDAFQRKIRQKSSGSTVTGIRSKLLEKLTIPIPPLALQREFAAFVEKVDKLAFAVRKSLESAEELYRQQLSEAFA